jgi:hypothetical protein
MIKPTEKLLPLLQETDELISILFTCVTTAKRNNDPQNLLISK